MFSLLLHDFGDVARAIEEVIHPKLERGETVLECNVTRQTIGGVNMNDSSDFLHFFLLPFFFFVTII